MSSKIHGFCTGTVIETWRLEQPPTGKPYQMCTIKLDDNHFGEKRFDGKRVTVKSYSQPQYLPDIREGDRICVTGSVDARGYLSKRDNKPMGALEMIAQTVALEVPGDVPAPEPAASAPADDSKPRF